MLNLIRSFSAFVATGRIGDVAFTPEVPDAIAGDINDPLLDESTKQKLNNTDTDALIARYVQPEFPSRVAISFGEAPCVLKCRMCPQAKEHDRWLFPNHRYMDWDVLKEISRQIPNDPDIQIEISAYCDPMQNKKCEAFIRHLRDEHPDALIILATEGICLNEERTWALLESGVSWISYSLNAGGREAYKWLTGTDQYELARGNLLRLIEYRDKMNGEKPKITTHIIGIKENEEDFESFTSEWREHLPDGVAIRTLGNWGGVIDGNVTPLETVDEPDWQNRYPCLNIFNANKIVSNGDYYLCFTDIYAREEPLGNIFETSIGDNWKSVFEEHRQRHMKGDFSHRLCEKCTIWSLLPNVFERNEDNSFRLKNS